jgi:hypothetical protein
MLYFGLGNGSHPLIAIGGLVIVYILIVYNNSTRMFILIKHSLWSIMVL